MNTKILCFMILYVSLTKADEAEDTNLKMDDMIEVFEPFTSKCEPKPKKEHIKELLIRKKNPQRETKCLRLCLMKQFDWINESETEIVIDKAVEFTQIETQIKAEEIKEFAVICAEKAKKFTDKCELANFYDECLVESIERQGFKFPVVRE